jgi:hypothetical protein
MIETTTSNSTTVTPLRDRSGNPNLLVIATPKTTNQRDKNPKTLLVEYRKALFCQKTPKDPDARSRRHGSDTDSCGQVGP